MDSIPLEFHPPTPSEVLDYGRIFQHSPSFVLKPKTPEDIALLLKCINSSPTYNNITVAARGAGHSTYGQAQALDGIVIDMTSLPTCIKIGKTNTGDIERDCFIADVGGGVLWVNLLKETLKHGLTPRSSTDYLFLTVGGTLSVGGNGGQTFKFGPQICNILEMDIITGKGDLITCSEEKQAELFHAVLGGLGQFGIIIRARVILDFAPKMVKCTTLFYDEFSEFTRDQEHLISMKEVDYLQGFIKRRDSESSADSKILQLSTGRMIFYYTIKMGIYYNEDEEAQKVLDRVLSCLSFRPLAVHTLDFSYFNFLNHVRDGELNLRSKGLWEVPHPWLNIFISRSHIDKIKDLVLETISAVQPSGPTLIYPILRNKWNPNMSAVLPKDDTGDEILYVIGLLWSAVPSSRLESILKQNQKIIDVATSKVYSHLGGMIQKGGVGSDEKCRGKDVMDMFDDNGGLGAKQYMPYCRNEDEWKVHFGEDWERFEELKSKFDPLNVLAPGQRIFKRKKHGSLTSN